MNLALAAGLAVVLGLGAPSTVLAIVIVLACAGCTVLVGVVLPFAMRWLHEHSGGPPWFVVPMAVLLIAAVSPLVIRLGETGLGLLPVADLWQVTKPILGMAVVAALGWGSGLRCTRPSASGAPSISPSRRGWPRPRRG